MEASTTRGRIRLFLCGDVAVGRGIDQILPHPGDPRLHEPVVTDARRYISLAERVNGEIPRRADFRYVWGDALGELRQRAADLAIVNLETGITTSLQWEQSKKIHYRMHPANVEVLSAAAIDCCALANNHVIDWGHDGLRQTLETLHAAGIVTAGAGLDLSEAGAPATFDTASSGRVLVYAFAVADSGVPESWAATDSCPGVNFLPDLGARTLCRVSRRIAADRTADDTVVVSIHWGGNWGYAVSGEQRAFARGLIDAGAAVVHGHSSHHPKGIEVYRQRLILYGCGDFLNDYEGIAGMSAYRGELSLMYFADIDRAGGTLIDLRMVPMRIARFRLGRAARADALWLRDLLTREGKAFGTRSDIDLHGDLSLRWSAEDRGAGVTS